MHLFFKRVGVIVEWMDYFSAATGSPGATFIDGLLRKIMLLDRALFLSFFLYYLLLFFCLSLGACVYVWSFEFIPQHGVGGEVASDAAAGSTLATP